MNKGLKNKSALDLATRPGIALGIAMLALIPSQALACNMIHGFVLNVFRFQQIARVPFVFNFIVIVLVEFLLFGLFLRCCKHWKALLYATVINVASSLALSLLFDATGNQFDPFYSWQDGLHSELYGNVFLRFLVDRGIPLLWYLCAAVVVEWPLSRLLTRRQVSWKKLLLVVLVANVVSYMTVSVSENFMMSAWYTHLREVDAKLLREWRDIDLLREAGGRIFALSEEELDGDGANGTTRYGGLTVDGKVMSSGPLGYRLRYFDCADGEWHAIANSPRISPLVWSLTTNRLAFLEDGQIRVVTFPGMENVSTVPTNHHAHAPSAIALSHNGTQLAVAFAESALTRKGGGSAVRRFIRNRILVYDVQSGALLRECPRWSLDGPLFWTPDSERLLFLSATDIGELERGVIGLERFRENADDVIHYGVDPKLRQGLYALNLASGNVELFSDSLLPLSQSRQFLVAARHSRLRTPRVELFDMKRKEISSVAVAGLGGWNQLMQVSPDGRFLCTESRLAWATCHAIIDLEDPDRRYVMSESPLIVRPIHSMFFVWLPE